MTNPRELWIGGLEQFMSESFILKIFNKFNEKPISVRVMRNKYTGETAGYGFVGFNSEDEAKAVYHKLNGKAIPNTTPPVRFRLNMSMRISPSEPEVCVWVGDLTPDVDDFALYKTFASRYQSIRRATVMVDTVGLRRGYGFIRLASEEEQKHCISHMNGFKGLGLKPIRTSTAHRGSVTISGGYSSSQDYSTAATPDSKDSKPAPTPEKRQNIYNFETSYWQMYEAWQCYEDSNLNVTHKVPSEMLPQVLESSTAHEDDLDLIEHNTKLDIDSSNKELIQRDFNFWDALECSKWTPVVCYE